MSAALEALNAARSALSAGLVRTDVLVGEVRTTPVRPYVVLTAQAPAVARRPIAGHSHLDRVTLMAMAVNDSLEGVLLLTESVRRILDDLPITATRLLRYDFASAPIEADDPGAYRWSLTADYSTYAPRRHRA